MRFLPVVAFLALCISVCAQSSRVVPAYAEKYDATFSNGEYFSIPSRHQQVIDGAAFCKSGALVQEIAYRCDARTSNAWRAAVLKNFELWLGNSVNSVGSLSATFAKNRSRAHTKLFYGTLNLPAKTPSQRWRVQPFQVRIKLAQPFVYVRKSGPLLIESSWPWSGNGVVSYGLDANASGGLAAPFGVGGPVGGVEAGLAAFDSQGFPGGQILLSSYFHYGSVPPRTPAVVLFGVSNTQWGAIRLPLVMDAFGAPGNRLYVSPDIALSGVYRAAGNASRLDFKLPIPGRSSWTGLVLYAQVLIAQKAANKFGIVFTTGVRFRIGAKTTDSQLITAAGSPSSSTGILKPHYAAPVVRVTGIIN